jgi:uncharacterized protein (TIGR03086 family)
MPFSVPGYRFAMDVVDLDQRAIDTLAVLIAGIPRDEYSAPTPCSDWLVADLITHLIAGNVKYTAIANGAEWTRTVPEVDAGDDPPAIYRATADEMLRAWRQPGVLDREIALPRGRGRAESALCVHLGETLVHGWDLATATGRPFAVDPDVVEARLANYTSWLPEQRAEGVPFSDAKQIPADAAPLDRLAAFLGRNVAP